jgi:rhamnose utilization protein RhaD (predicted bifunctional aldolase and dehydrogenase)/NAD(P)-dependent dehydrogenase (short-subunit alcohol dehydrogenase family)
VDWAQDDVDQCVQASRLLGSDASLVLHGGGNSSVKTGWRDVTGRTVEAIYVKGTGRDLASITADGFAPLRLSRLHELLELDALGDGEMARELSAARLDPGSPQPSVEALVHAFLPHPAVLHSHADAIATLTNSANGEELLREALGEAVVVVPYVMPGFDLAREVRSRWPDQAGDGTEGMVLLHHGLFTFGRTSREAYERHLALVGACERLLASRAQASDGPGPPALPDVPPTELAGLRRAISAAAGRPLVVRRHTGPVVRRFVARPDLASLAGRGPLTPDHVIRTKPTPLVGRDVEGFAAAYAAYFEEHAPGAGGGLGLQMLDPAPRIVLDPELGMLTAGVSARDAQIAADIYHHTIPALELAEDRLGGYVALPPERLFEVEYWELEQAKLRATGEAPALAGTVAVVTGAASGIGRACARELLARGAAVAGIDLRPADAGLGLVADVRDPAATGRALREAVEAFGGVDIAVLCAGVFDGTAPLTELDPEEWLAVMEVNAGAAARLLGELQPLLARSPVGGRVVVVGSKNVAAPGRGAAAYSASKAALTQVARVAALEWARDGIRVNVVHPDAVFDTALWTEDLLAERAAQHGLDADAYRRRNLLGAEITSADVARAVVALCDDTFRVTTGAQIPVDGGNDRVL